MMVVPEGHKVIQVYRENDGYVEYCKFEDRIHANAHSYKNKYSIGMLRALKQVLAINKVLLCSLPHKYLVDFYSKHYEVTSLGRGYYQVKDTK